MHQADHTPVLPGSGWRSVLIVTWFAVFACMLAIAVSSRTIGRPVWWLGPSTRPAPLAAVAIPIVLVFAPLATAMRAPRHCVRTSLVCAILLIVNALPDVPDRFAVAIGAGTVGAAALLATIGVMVGQRQYR